jgi:probable HAF family extracellular repeat protein
MARTTAMLASAALLCFTLAAKADPINYNFVSFNGPGNNGGGTTVNGISNSGAIVGFSMFGGGILNTNFVRNPDGTFTTLNIAGDPLASANGINASGIVVGATSQGQAFVFDNGIVSILPAVLPVNTAGETAFGINDGNTIVGQFVDNLTDTTPGFVDANGQFTMLNPVVNAAVTNAQGINNQGDVVGFYSTDGAHQHGFLFNTTTQQYTLLADPNVPNLFLTQFLGVNDNGLAVGYWQDNAGNQHGFLYNLSTGTYTFLDNPNAVVSNGVEITQITGINDLNEITGFFVDPNGVQEGFLATVATPEPASASMVLIGLGFAGIVWRRNAILRRRKQTVSSSTRN